METVLTVKQSLRVPRDVVRTFMRSAELRGVDPDTIAGQVLANVSRDGLVDAVLDDGKQTPSGNDRFDRMQRALDNANFRVSELESILFAQDLKLPVDWQLVRREEQIFRLLLTKDLISKDQVCTAIYDMDLDTKAESVESHVSKLRRKVAQFGAEIRTRRYLGYSLVERSAWRERLRAA